MNRGKMPFSAQPKKKKGTNSQVEPVRYMTAKGISRPRNGMQIITGRRPTLSEMAGVRKAPTVAEMPSEAISHDSAVGDMPLVLIR